MVIMVSGMSRGSPLQILKKTMYKNQPILVLFGTISFTQPPPLPFPPLPTPAENDPGHTGGGGMFMQFIHVHEDLEIEVWMYGGVGEGVCRGGVLP